MEVIRDYSELLELAIAHPVESLLDRCVKKKIVTEGGAESFLRELGLC